MRFLPIVACILASVHADDRICIAFHNNATLAAAMEPANAPANQGTVVNTATTRWNHPTSPAAYSFANFALTRADGTASGATLSGTTGYTGSNTNGWAAKTKDSVMMEGWYGIRGTEALTVSNLPAAYATGFTVIVYGDSNDTARTMNYTVGGTTRTIQDAGTFNGTFTEGANFNVFSGLTGTGFTLTGNTAALPRSAVCGLVILPGNLPQPPVITSFKAAAGYVAAGADATLSWSTTGAETITLTPIPTVGGTATAAGSLTFPIAATTTYTLAATNAAGTTRASVRIGVGPPRPNILVFLVDDMGWQDCSLPFLYQNGQPVRTPLNQKYRTPNLEMLAAHGLRFTNATAHTVCSPSRVSLMTGMTAARHHVTNWTYPTDPRQTDNNNATLNPPADWRMSGMDAGDSPLPRIFQQAGYRTIHSGKAHFGPDRQSDGVTPNPSGDPRSLGFDINIAGWGAGGPGSYLSENFYGTAALWHVPGLESYYTPVQTRTHLTEALTLEMNKAITQSVDDRVPFFAYLSHYAIHAPYEVDTRFSANYPGLTGTTLGHATLVEGMDKSLGDVLRKLDDLGIAENTLILFLGDNGAESPNTGTIPNPSAPLRGRKGTPYEGGMRVPLLAAWAKADPTNPHQARIPLPQGGHQDDIVTIDDVFPTLVDVASLPVPAPLDGRTLLPYFRGDAGHHRPQEFVCHMPHSHNDSFYSTLRQGNWKVIHRYLTRSWELYDLAADPGETQNLATNPSAANASRLMTMGRHLARELRRYGAQFPTEDATGNTRAILLPDLSAVDSDGDGIPDTQEDPNRNGLQDAGESDPDNADTDGDGTKDGDEIRTGADPLDATSSFRALPCLVGPGVFEIEWPSKPGAFYRVESSGDLAATGWLVEADNHPAATTAPSTRFTVSVSGDPPRRFFRVVLK